MADKTPTDDIVDIVNAVGKISDMLLWGQCGMHERFDTVKDFMECLICLNDQGKIKYDGDICEKI